MTGKQQIPATGRKTAFAEDVEENMGYYIRCYQSFTNILTVWHPLVCVFLHAIHRLVKEKEVEGK